MSVEKEFDFEEFDRAARPVSTTPTVTWQTRGPVGLSFAAYEMLGSPDAVTLHFDKARRVMGICAAEPEAHNAIQVRKQAASQSYLFTGVAFASRYGIPVGGRALRYLAEPYGQDMIVVDLNQEGAAVSPTRVKSGEQGQHALSQ
jgi:hypothetical protein